MASQSWPRIVLHVDMDAFFAQVEQRDNPDLRGKPVCVTNGERGSCIITRSYEARAYGVKTGMRWRDAVRLCPTLVRCPSRPRVYASVSTQIMTVLDSITPDLEIFSVDEAFLDLSRCRELYQSAQQVGRLIKRRVWEVSGLTCSVGISGDKTTAKIASKRSKPNGLLVIPPWLSRHALAPLPVTDICGISRGIAQFLAQYGVYYCGQMQNIPISVLAKRFGHLGRRLWYMCQGADPDRVSVTVAPPKSMGHGKVMPPKTNDLSVILSYLCHMAEKVGKRLRTHRMTASAFFIGIKVAEGWIADKCKIIRATDDGLLIYQLAKGVVERHWQGEGVFQCQITALNPQTGSGQADLFATPEPDRHRVNAVTDAINRKFGEGCLVNGVRMRKLEMPDVIAPAWRPTGHRATVEGHDREK